MSNRNVIATSQVTTLVSAATTDRWQILIENYGSVSIWIGDDSDVSAGEDGTGSEVRPKCGREFNFETELKYDQFQNSPPAPPVQGLHSCVRWESSIRNWNRSIQGLQR